MVWRKIVCMLFCVSVIVAMATIPTAAATVYEGTISSTYSDIAKDMLPKTSINDDYVFFRSGQYTYTLVYGDLDYTGTTFSSSETVQQNVIQYNTGSSYSGNQHYTVTSSDVSSFSLDTGGILVYSNLGAYPALEERRDVYDFVTSFTLCVIGLCALVRPVYSFVLRRRDYT